MLYIFLIIIAVLLYLIYRGQKKPRIKSETEISEDIQSDIDHREARVLEDFKTSHLTTALRTQRSLFDVGKKNYIRLQERSKHDPVKLKQANKDWIDYLDLLQNSILESEMIDTASNEQLDLHMNKREELLIRIYEIDKRFKELLGKDYRNPCEKGE